MKISTVRLIAFVILGCVLASIAPAQESALRRAVDPVSPTERSEREAAEAEAERAAEADASPSEETAEPQPIGGTIGPAIAQMMMVTLGGTQGPNPSDRQFLRTIGPGAVIIPPVTRQTVAAAYVGDVMRMNAFRAQYGPPLIGTDLFNLPRSQPVFRSYFAQMPSLMAIAAADHPPATARFAEATAEQLKAMGFSLHLGPALSLSPDVTGGISSVQSLGSDPAFAARTASTICTALMAESIIPMCTGFPGGGNNRTAGAPPVLLTATQQLGARDLLPFRAAIEAGVPIMHVGTTLVPTIDPSGSPACLSPIVMQEYLRGHLGFEGVIVAGPIDSPDLTANRSIFEVAREAIMAGADMLVFTGELNTAAATVERLMRAVEAGDIPEERIRASVARIAALKAEYALAERAAPREAVARRQETSRTYGEIAYEIERRSVTLLYDNGGVLPLREGASEPILVTGGHYVVELDEALERHFRRVLIQPLKSAEHGGAILDFDVQRAVRQAEALGTVIAIFPVGTPESRTPKVRGGQRDLVAAVKARGTRIVVLLLGHPDNIDHLLEADAIIQAYPSLPDRGGPPMITQTIRAVADVMVGQGPIRILPPVRDIEAVAGSPEQYNALEVVVTPTGRLPVAISTARDTGSVLFPAGHGVPYSTEATIRRARWEFGDGGRSNGVSTQYTHKTPGRYPITLSIEDQTREQVDATFHVVVRDPADATAAAAE